MEDGLRGRNSTINQTLWQVLILVLMEDGLRDEKASNIIETIFRVS